MFAPRLSREEKRAIRELASRRGLSHHEAAHVRRLMREEHLDEDAAVARFLESDEVRTRYESSRRDFRTPFWRMR